LALDPETTAQAEVAEYGHRLAGHTGPARFMLGRGHDWAKRNAVL